METKIKRFNSDSQAASLFTLLVYFKTEFATNGSEKGRKFHSQKYEKVLIGGQVITHHKFAFDKLLSFVLKDIEGRYKTALIYHNPSSTEVLRLAHGTFRKEREVLFTADNTGKGSIFLKIN
jgi:hypothetical protein